MTRLALECTDEQFHGLHKAADLARRNAKAVTVGRTDLAALLRDHAAMYARLKEMGEEPTTMVRTS